MSRPSAAALGVVPVNERNRLAPPAGMHPEAAEIWRELVKSVPIDHFHTSDGPILRSYVEVTARIAQAQANLRKQTITKAGRPSPWFLIYDRSVKTQATLALRLRLSPMSRKERKSTARSMRAVPSAGPWSEAAN